MLDAAGAMLALAVSLPLALALGGPLGLVLFQLERAPPSTPAQLVHGLCSLPCILVLLALSAPLAQWLAQWLSGWQGNHGIALALAAIPYFARLVAASLRVVPHGLIEAAQAMGASPLQIVTRVLLPEARAALRLAAGVLAVSLLAWLTVAGLSPALARLTS